MYKLSVPFMLEQIDKYGAQSFIDELKKSMRTLYFQHSIAIKWIQSLEKKLPAIMLGNPDCYMLCKENEREKAVWIGNFFADECLNTTIILDKEYKEIECIHCKGKLNGNAVELEEIPPYASIGFLLR